MKKINEIAEESDKAISCENQRDIERLIRDLEIRLKTNSPVIEKCYCHYILGNLYSGHSRLLKEDASGWRNDNFPKNLTSEINHLRLAEALISAHGQIDADAIRTNLANALSKQRRNIEILDYWKCDFTVQGDASFVSSISKARELLWISHWLNDPSHTHLYQYEAYLLLQELQKHISKKDHSEVINLFNTNTEVINLLEMGGELFSPLENLGKTSDEIKYANKEKEYRAWCLKNRLFANPVNDLTTEWFAARDILQFPNYKVRVGDGPYLSAAFSSLKREYCFARFMAYEGIHKIHPTFENEKLFLTNTLDYVHYSGSIEKIKTSFRICFSVFDSIAFLLNFYFDCNSKVVSFSSRWIKDNFKDKEGNYFIDALYWLACDLTDNPELTSNPIKWKAPNPCAAEIRKIRNAIEHGWLRVAEQDSGIWNASSDFAHIVTPGTLQKHTLFVLKLVRAAMLYLCMAVTYNEKSTAKSESFIPTNPILLVDDDLISL